MFLRLGTRNARSCHAFVTRGCHEKNRDQKHAQILNMVLEKKPILNHVQIIK